MIVIGLMSGTSLDGVDAVACRITPQKNGLPKIERLAAAKVAYPPKLRARLLAVSRADGTTAEVCALHHEVGEKFAAAALKVAATLPPRQRPELIASHGQTIHHLPERHATLQVGDAHLIARRTGLPVRYDFRSADLAAGGEGAPLAPVVHLPLFADRRAAVTVVNLGGIANLTHLPAGAARLDDLIAYDTGPGNMLIDEAVRRIGKGNHDGGGRIAASAPVDEGLLARLLDHPYFSRRPPKSTGREAFGDPFIERAGMNHRRFRWDASTVATVTELTARTVANEIHALAAAGRPTGRIVCCGGGAKNRHLLRRIAALTGVAAVPSDRLGVPATQVEGILMALLGWYGEHGIALDLRSVTGSRSAAVILGSGTGPVPAS